MSGVAAIAFIAAFTSCSKSTDLYEEGRKERDQQAQNEQKVVKSYEDAFEAAFGKPAEDQDWGLSKYGMPSNAGTRAYTVNEDNFDVFTIPSKADRDAMFPAAAPKDADEVSELLEKYKGQTANGQTMYDLYAIYTNKITAGYNLKITKAGSVDVGGCKNSRWDGSKTVYDYYNVYVDVDGDVVINRPQDSHFNLYIIRGNVSFGSTQASQLSSPAITIAEGASLTDPRSEAAANGGVTIYNRGTYTATATEGFDVGNNAVVYNEGEFRVSGDLHYTAGAGNTPIFYNIGSDSKLEAASMTMNSNCHFFNEGEVDIEGKTYVTQRDIYWVNNGHYTTGSMEFSAHNETFYNYCNLLVKGHMKLTDGKFYLRNDSYTEAASANFGNSHFEVHMGNKAGINIKGDVSFAANGDGTDQGFFASGEKAYVLIGGKATVAGHKHSFDIDGNITFAIKGGIVDLGANNSGVQPTYEFRNGATQVEEADYSQFSATAKTDDCGATWKVPGRKYTNRIMGEDLTAEASNDFDFNDVVFDWAISADKKTAYIKLLAAGGTRPLKIGAAVGEGEEVHGLFNVGTTTMVNTGLNGGGITKDPVEFEITKTSGTFETAADIIVSVDKGDAGAGWTKMTAGKGKATSLLFIPLNTKWVDEYVDIEKAFPGFSTWVTTNVEPNWASPVEKYVDLNLSNND